MHKGDLRKILYKYLPQELVDRPKQGFGVPIYEWFRNELKELYMDYLNREKVDSLGIFNYKEIERMMKLYLEGKGINHHKLWLLFIFQLWQERWLN